MGRLIKFADIQAITNLNELYQILTPARESSIKYILNKYKDDINNLNKYLTNALNVKNKRAPLNINLPISDLKVLLDKYVFNVSDTITNFTDIYKYISADALEAKLKPNLVNQFVALLKQFRYSITAAILLRFDPTELFDAYFANNLLPLIKQLIPHNIDIKSDDMDNKLYNFLADYLDDAIDQYIEELKNKNDLRLKDYLTEHEQEFLNAKKQIIRIICSKKYFDKYIKKNHLPPKQIEKIQRSHILHFYRNVIREFFSKVLHIDFNQYSYLEDDIIKYLELDDLYNLSFFRTLNTYILPDTRKKIKILEEKDEPIGEETNINICQLDINNREKPFVIIGTRFYLGRPGESHANLVNRLQKNNGDVFRRENIDIGDESIAFGHVVNKIAFIEHKGISMNLSINDIIQILKATHQFTKIYTVPDNRSVIRLAKKRR